MRRWVLIGVLAVLALILLGSWVLSTQPSVEVPSKDSQWQNPGWVPSPILTPNRLEEHLRQSSR